MKYKLQASELQWEHTFVTAQPNAHVRFRRAIERRALWMAEDAARELPDLPCARGTKSIGLCQSTQGDCGAQAS
jgi:hypothetical protein